MVIMNEGKLNVEGGGRLDSANQAGNAIPWPGELSLRKGLPLQD